MTPKAANDQRSLCEADLTRLVPKLSRRGGTICNLLRLSGGASQETWSFSISNGDQQQPYILRRAPADIPQHETAAGLEAEAAVIQVMSEHEVPVPEIFYVLQPGDDLGRGFVCSYVFGETIARRILRDTAYSDVRGKLVSEFGRLLAAIHRVPSKDLPPLRTAGVEALLAGSRQWLDRLPTPRPTFEFALRWLADNRPEERTPYVVHGDFRLGNLIIDKNGVRAVLDWELVHFGDPMEDLAWLCLTPWRFGNIDRPVAGLGMRDQLFASYDAAGGVAEPERVRWWEVAGSLRWGLICAESLCLFQPGSDRAVERAMIARRASESEFDLLSLIEGCH